MRFFRVIGLISILPLLVSAANSDSLWSSNDDSLFSDTDFSLNQPALPYDQTAPASPFGLAELPVDLASSPTTTDSSVFSLDNTDLFSSANDGVLSSSLSDDDMIFDDALEIADCSTSEFLPAIGKSRARRQDIHPACRAPTKPPITDTNTPKGPAGDQTPDLSGLNELLKNPGILQMLTGARSNDDHNTFCYLYTQGRLPYGTCSSGRPEDERKTGAQMQIQDWPAVDVYALTHCTNAGIVKHEALPFLVQAQRRNYSAVNKASFWWSLHMQRDAYN